MHSRFRSRYLYDDRAIRYAVEDSQPGWEGAVAPLPASMSPRRAVADVSALAVITSSASRIRCDATVTHACLYCVLTHAINRQPDSVSDKQPAS